MSCAQGPSAAGGASCLCALAILASGLSIRGFVNHAGQNDAISVRGGKCPDCNAASPSRPCAWAAGPVRASTSCRYSARIRRLVLPGASRRRQNLIMHCQGETGNDWA